MLLDKIRKYKNLDKLSRGQIFVMEFGNQFKKNK